VIRYAKVIVSRVPPPPEPEPEPGPENEKFTEVNGENEESKNEDVKETKESEEINEKTVGNEDQNK
jgi:hypothetical protein